MAKTNNKIIWRSEKRKISELNPAKYNPRELTEKQMQDLSISLEKFSLADPIIINRSNTIIGGHQRINILKQKYSNNGVEVDVRVPSRLLTQDEEVELNLRLNKNLGQWDFDALANFDEELLKDVGFESQELDKIFQLDMPDEDDVPEVRKTNIKLGDCFKLSEHRLLCGDATKREDVERLMQGEKAGLVYSDPPYGVQYDGGVGSERLDGYKDVYNDYSEFLYSIYSLAFEYSDEKSALMIWYATKKTLEVLLTIKRCGYSLREILIWNKPNAHYGALMCQYKIRYEPCIYAYKNGFSPRWFGDTTQRNLVDIEQPSKNKLHPTMKPIELYEIFIPNHIERDGIVYEPFGGSGSTLIACEKLNRKCRMMEIDPIYCQVILDRWEKFTGQKAIKLNDLSMAEDDRSLASIR